MWIAVFSESASLGYLRTFLLPHLWIFPLKYLYSTWKYYPPPEPYKTASSSHFVLQMKQKVFYEDHRQYLNILSCESAWSLWHIFHLSCFIDIFSLQTFIYRYLKWMVGKNRNVLSFFCSHPHVNPNLCDLFSSVKHKIIDREFSIRWKNVQSTLMVMLCLPQEIESNCSFFSFPFLSYLFIFMSVYFFI